MAYLIKQSYRDIDFKIRTILKFDFRWQTILKFNFHWYFIVCTDCLYQTVLILGIKNTISIGFRKGKRRIDNVAYFIIP